MAREPYVLVVDDDPENLRLLVMQLEKSGYNVTTASDAMQEIIQVQGVRVGLVITDIQMPGVGSGTDAVKKLRSTPGVSPLLPVVFMTALDKKLASTMIPADPKVKLISKPVDFEELRVVIRQLTGLDRPI